MKKLITKISEVPQNIRLITASAVVHILTIVGIVYYWDTLDFFWFWVMISGILIIGCIGGEAYLHRYCTHNSFELSKPLKSIIHFFSIFNLQGSSVDWAVAHTQHHKHSDTDKDIFQPKKDGFKTWFWLNFHYTFDACEFGPMHKIKTTNDDMRFMNNNYWKIYFSVIIISTIIDPRFTIFFFFVPVIDTLLATGITNVFSHLDTFMGYRNFDTPDNSRNFRIPFIVGNTYHNNHHNDPNNYNIAVKWYEFDHIAWLINLLLFIDNLFKSFAKIFKTHHIISKTGEIVIWRCGIWHSNFSILFSKIIPIKKEHNLEQFFHSHHGSFLSFILWGNYEEDILTENGIVHRKHRLYNFISHKIYHRVYCDKPCYTITFGGKIVQEPSIKLRSDIKSKSYNYRKFFEVEGR